MRHTTACSNGTATAPQPTLSGSTTFRQVLINHGIFWQSVRNTLIVLAVSLFIQLPLALGLALMVYEKTPANTLFRLVFFLPYILAEIACD